MSNRIVDYFKSNNLKLNQFGFRNYRSTTQAVFDLMDEVVGAVDGPSFAVDALFLDPSKASDCVKSNT